MTMQPQIQSRSTIYALYEDVGRGTYGGVKRCTCLKSLKDFAVKIISKQIMMEMQAEEYVLNEIRLQTSLNHHNILKLIEYFEDDACIYLILEYCAKGTLQQAMHSGKLTEEQIFHYVYQINEGLIYLHSLNIAHRDIKPENILLTDTGTVKICDFNWSCRGTSLPVLCGTTVYMPPEVILLQEHNYKVDIWSLGVILYQLFNKKLPFYGDTESEIMEAILTNSTFQQSSHVPIDVQVLTMQLLNRVPQSRIEAQQIRQSKWFKRHSTRIHLKRVSNPIQVKFSREKSPF